jgi:hypothetical protein
MLTTMRSGRVPRSSMAASHRLQVGPGGRDRQRFVGRTGTPVRTPAARRASRRQFPPTGLQRRYASPPVRRLKQRRQIEGLARTSIAAVYASSNALRSSGTNAARMRPGAAVGLADHHRSPGAAGTVTSDRFGGNHAGSPERASMSMQATDGGSVEL